jgi:hypothetical protein
MSTKNVLAALSDSNTAITLGIELAGQLIPLGKGLIKEIRSIATGAETVSYEVLLVADGKELDAVHQLATDDLAAINAELAKMGQPPLPVAPPTTDPPPVTQ